MPIDINNITVLNDLSFFERLRYQLKSLMAIIVLVLLITATFFFLTKYIKTEHKNAAYQQFLALQSTSAQLSSARHYDEAANLWIAYAPKAPTETIASMAYINAAALYINNSQYMQALTMCNQAKALDGTTLDEVSAAATAYKMLGDKTEAIKDYRIEKRLLPSNALNRNIEIVEINQAIKELQS
jgi:tetratricopeptide (TPR) repeat protein